MPRKEPKEIVPKIAPKGWVQQTGKLLRSGLVDDKGFLKRSLLRAMILEDREFAYKMGNAGAATVATKLLAQLEQHVNAPNKQDSNRGTVQILFAESMTKNAIRTVEPEAAEKPALEHK